MVGNGPTMQPRVLHLFLNMTVRCAAVCVHTHVLLRVCDVCFCVLVCVHDTEALSPRRQTLMIRWHAHGNITGGLQYPGRECHFDGRSGFPILLVLLTESCSRAFSHEERASARICLFLCVSPVKVHLRCVLRLNLHECAGVDRRESVQRRLRCRYFWQI